MRTVKIVIVFLAILICGVARSQSRTDARKKSKGRRTIEKIDQTSQKVDKTTREVNTTTDSVTNSIERTKRTARRLKETIFGSKKNKVKNASSEAVQIKISNVAYADENLKALYHYFSTAKGIKKVTKNYANGTAVITINSKENADILWDRVPANLQNKFEVAGLNQKEIILKQSSKNQ